MVERLPNLQLNKLKHLWVINDISFVDVDHNRLDTNLGGEEKGGEGRGGEGEEKGAEVIGEKVGERNMVLQVRLAVKPDWPAASAPSSVAWYRLSRQPQELPRPFEQPL